MKYIIFGRWCSCNCYTVTYISHLHPVLTCVNSCKKSLSAKEIVEAQWYSRILNLYTYIPYCVFNPLHSKINIYAYSPYFSLCSGKKNLLNNEGLFFVSVHFLIFLCALTRRICTTIKSFFWQGEFAQQSKDFFVSGLIYGWHCKAKLAP